VRETSFPVVSGPRLPEFGDPTAVRWGLWTAEVALELRAAAHDVDATADLIVGRAVRVIPLADCARLVRVKSAEFRSLTEGVAAGGGELGELHRSMDRVVAGETSAVSAGVSVAGLPREYQQGLAGSRSGSLLVLRLSVQERLLGALVLSSGSPTAFPPEVVRSACLYALHAAVAMANAQDLANLRAAIGGRDRIGQAKGILMERYKLTDDQAFMLLAKISQNTNTALRLVAEQLTRTGELPSAARR